MRKKVYSAAITPLHADGSLDENGLNKLFDRNIRHGVDGFFLLGSMGEWGSFSEEFKEELIRIAAAALRGRAELLVGINATSLPLSLKLLERYSTYEFDSYVFMLPGRTSALDPVKSIFAVLDAADRPVYYYHCPPNNNINLSPDDFAAIMRHPKLKGIKNSAGSMYLRRELLRLRDERRLSTRILEGQEWAVDEALIVGCDGMLCGMGALASKVLTGIAGAVDTGNIAEAIRRQNILIDIFHGVYGSSLENVWNGQKYALAELGLIASPFTYAQEMSSLSDAAKQRISACLARYRDELD
ncbi:dihydrodipicolinate synthase family protein [Victivallis sp. Marseille-Q1083]|uniref:dihydrodipicolinate synthase family protein n=1 Tax=Victivallis sp. Marseille-Q1083 TaxID=2717288 RepID=UPI00158A6DDE|nr:dihydrodipicolinate synthase family protein [Victivallis sp. Marseille-Q1083]